MQSPSRFSRRRALSAGALLAVALVSPAGPASAVPTTPVASPAADASYAHPDWLVDPAWLQANRGRVNAVALTSAKEFTAGHIPGAAQIDWPELNLADTSEGSIQQWQRAVEGKLTTFGLAPSDTIVIYDGGTLFAARLWWVLDQIGQADQRILNGGLDAWKAAGGPLEQGASTVQPAVAPYQGTPNPADLATLSQVKSALNDPGTLLVDARTAQEYAAGHIPGAVNIDFPRNAAPAAPKVWKPAADLRAMYAAAGVTPDKRVIPYCSTGVRSAVTSFTLRLLGYPDVRLYTGSWQEWSRNPELPIAYGPNP